MSYRESQITECKQIWKDEYLKTITALANTDGGTLWIGIDDHGQVLGLTNIKELLETLPNKINNRLGIINALIHRDYSDTSVLQIRVYDEKIVFSNGATLSPEVPIEKFTQDHISKPFNPIIASVFYKAGLVESWGKGTVNIIDECLKAGLPSPEYKYTFGAVQVTFHKKETTPITTPITTKDALIALILKRPKITREELASELGISINTVKEYILNLKKSGTLNRVGDNRNGYWEINANK